MPEITTARTLQTSQEKAWAVISDPTRFAEWNTLHTSWGTQPPTDLAVGTTMTEVVTIKGVVDTIDFTTTDYDAPRFVQLEGSGSTASTVQLDFTVEPDGDTACVATLHVIFNASILFGPLGKIVQKAFGKQLDKSLEKLSEIVE
ncbi:type II toxin-antitoxin system Rv0910 family toxin [Williamsia herbipolensis]|uniref:type II toxin-antitoxin system Rv0910 family toxin n=1 Tax=Williamsia herbipolensis TaxID=1603258 RepID=UPI0005F87411|nr:SRPBCC family protein [Williamsia herbipolensis]